MENILLPLHLITLAFVAWTIIRADHLGFQWIRGTIARLPEEKVKRYHKNTWIGLGLMVITGFFLFLPMREFLLTRPQFYIKMTFVLALIANGFIIGILQKRAITKSYKELSFNERLPLFVSGAISTIAWLGAATMAFFLLPD